MTGSLESAGKALIVLGAAIAALGGLLLLAGKVPWLGRLPGDIRVERPGFSFYFPLTTCLLLSAIVTALAYLFKRK